MIVHCYNSQCKPVGKCRKPAHSLDPRFSNEQLRTGRENFSCSRCKSTFVLAAEQTCFTCADKGVPPPHDIVTTVACFECKESQCRQLKDFAANTDKEECPVCDEECAIKVSEQTDSNGNRRSNESRSRRRHVGARACLH
jgi:hypothetical protein